MDGSLRNKTMIVTGASSGIGRAVARRFAAEGVKLALVARSAERLKAVANEIGSECIVLPLDLDEARRCRDHGQNDNGPVRSHRHSVRQCGKLCRRRGR